MGTHDPATHKPRLGSIVVSVVDKDGEHAVIADAGISVFRRPGATTCAGFRPADWQPAAEDHVDTRRTNRQGIATFDDLEPASYAVVYLHVPDTVPTCVRVTTGCVADVCIEVPLDAEFEETFQTDDCQPVPCAEPRVGDRYIGKFPITNTAIRDPISLIAPPGARIDSADKLAFSLPLNSAGPRDIVAELLLPKTKNLPGAPAGGGPARLTRSSRVDPTERLARPIGGNIGVSLQRTATTFTSDLSHWQAIVNSTEALSFNSYFRFMDLIFCGPQDLSNRPKFEQDRFGLKEQRHRELLPKRLLPFIDADAYRVVKVATEAFVMVNCGIMEPNPRPFDDARDRDFFARRDLPFPSNGLDAVFETDYLVPFEGGAPGKRTLPYLAVIRRKLSDIDIKLEGFDVTPTQASECFGILQEKLTNPCLIELIWSYWHEEGMLVQTANAIARRFQNVRGATAQDPLANLEIDPLRPLNNLLWGYVQDEQHRLSVVRRNYEYDHHYGLRLDGRAVQAMNPADTRSKFLEAFHNLLRLANTFFKQDDDTTVKADAFPVLNALKEVHLILTEGQHNQFGDLPSTARIEMLMQQWLLARPEFREFLPTRISVAYPEPWMDRVDAMKKLQGWTDTSVLHFRNLAIFGEQIILSIRWGFWSDVQEPLQAFNWLRAFRPQIQGYIHAYRAVAGVDLAAEIMDTQVDATMPSALLRRRLVAQQQQQRGA